jgi:hypothetical protein
MIGIKARIWSASDSPAIWPLLWSSNWRLTCWQLWSRHPGVKLGKLGAIAAIRTFLNFFLGHEMEEEAAAKEEGAGRQNAVKQ